MSRRVAAEISELEARLENAAGVERLEIAVEAALLLTNTNIPRVAGLAAEARAGSDRTPMPGSAS